jgi:hypothetical protein
MTSIALTNCVEVWKNAGGADLVSVLCADSRVRVHRIDATVVVVPVCEVVLDPEPRAFGFPDVWCVAQSACVGVLVVSLRQDIFFVDD